MSGDERCGEDIALLHFVSRGISVKGDAAFYADIGYKGILRMEWKLDKDGYIGLPPGPGLGVVVDEAKLEEEAKKPRTYRWPGAKLRDGSVSDY
jgi:hypothetical protein